MNGEFLSTETAQKIVRLEKENKQYEKIICDFDKEVNRLFNIIKHAYKYVDEQLSAEYVQIKELKDIFGIGFNKAKEGKDEKATAQ